MSYSKTTWQTGDTVTAELLNHMEDGIAAGESVMYVNVTYDSSGPTSFKYKLNHTYTEIKNAINAGNEVILIYDYDMFHLAYKTATDIKFFKLQTENVSSGQGFKQRYFLVHNQSGHESWAQYSDVSKVFPNGYETVDIYYDAGISAWSWDYSDYLTATNYFLTGEKAVYLRIAESTDGDHGVPLEACDQYPLLKVWEEEYYDSYDQNWYKKRYGLFGKINNDSGTLKWKQCLIWEDTNGYDGSATWTEMTLSVSGSSVNPTV